MCATREENEWCVMRGANCVRAGHLLVSPPDLLDSHCLLLCCLHFVYINSDDSLRREVPEQYAEEVIRLRVRATAEL